jgi:eukaryotic-like serine/threonine-protein kinase
MDPYDAPTAAAPTQAIPFEAASEPLPARIGPYRVLQQLGEGGMGVVYLAEQTTPIFRRVAVKVLKLGMDTRQFVARFEAERQALAVMDHPGIARVLDAGASDAGRPYYVMELVHGVPITDYCDRERLSPRDRVALMVGVCHAVQHAHQKGIIHRDLKPSNVLVGMQDGVAVSKIIDFGVAKAIDRPLTNLTLFTEIGQRIGTPAYMSPEQMEMSGLDIDTRSDIYSLGVLLYELLTGTLPFSEEVVRRAVTSPGLLRRTDPQTPSSRVTSRGDKISDVASRRRSDPAALQRALAGDLDWITLKAMAMDRARRYETANGFAMDLQRYLAFEPVTARPPSARDRVGKFVHRHRVGVGLTLAIAILLIASTVALAVQARRLARERDRAEREAARASSVTSFLRDTLSSADPWSGGARDVSVADALKAAETKIDQSFAREPLAAANVRQTIAETYTGLGKLAEAERLGRAALDGQRRELGGAHEGVAASLVVLADVHMRQGRYAEAEREAREALGIRERLTGRADEHVAACLSQLGRILNFEGKYEPARQAAEEGLAIRRRVLGPRDPRIADSLAVLASIASTGQSNYKRVDELLREALTIRRQSYGRDDANVASTLNDLAVNRVMLEDYPQAETLYQESLAISRRVLGEGHPEIASTLENLGGVYYRTKRYDEVLKLLDQVLAMRKAGLGEQHAAVGRTLANMGAVRIAARDFAGAVAPLQDALTRMRATVGAEHPELVIPLINLGEAYRATGNGETAERTFREALALATKTRAPGHLDIARAQVALGRLLTGASRFDEAERLLLAAREIREQKLTAEHALTRAAASDLVSLYDAWGRRADADKWRSPAAAVSRPAK